MCESGRMAQTSSILLNAGDRERLTALVADRNRPHKHVQRARIILCSDERLPVLQIAKRVGVSRPAVWRWQQRFAEEPAAAGSSTPSLVTGRVRQHVGSDALELRLTGSHEDVHT